MDQTLYAGLSIRTGAVRNVGAGYFLAADLAKEEEEEPYAKIFKWGAGIVSQSWANFDAHTICIVTIPEPAVVFVGGYGEYGIFTASSLAGNIFDGDPTRTPYGMFVSINAIAGQAYAVGLRGMVYRLDDLRRWSRIDSGLPSTFDIVAIDGFGSSDLYAVGYRGEGWHFDGRVWEHLHLPTNVNLTSVKCAGDGSVYIAGYDGTLVKGRSRIWNVIARGETAANIWDLEWFEEKLYLSTMLTIYRLRGDALELVNLGDDPPETCYHLSAVPGLMWSIGSDDIVAFDGSVWSRVV
jgi:hypothetical protein